MTELEYLYEQLKKPQATLDNALRYRQLLTEQCYQCRTYKEAKQYMKMLSEPATTWEVIAMQQVKEIGERIKGICEKVPDES